MTDDPRVIVAQEWLVQPDGRHLEIARAFLAELDAVDPLRQPVSGNGLPDRLRSTTELMANVASVPMDVWDRHSNTCLEAASEIERLRALAAADRVQAPAEKPDMTLTDEDLGLIREWFNAVQDLSKEFLDRRDFALAKRILVHHGWRVPNSVERGCQHAETKSSHPRRGETWSAAHEAEKPDFPPWSRKMSETMKFLLLDAECAWLNRNNPIRAAIVADIRRAVFPETQDAG